MYVKTLSIAQNMLKKLLPLPVSMMDQRYRS
jgi:hypothetical protein